MNAREKLAKAIEEANSLMGEAVIEAFAEVFAAIPEAELICFVAYSPYFNDGDACTFSVHEPRVRLAGTPEDSEDGDYEDGCVSSWYLKEEVDGGRSRKSTPASDALDNLSSVLDNAEDYIRRVFGEHVQVTAYRDGRVECDHYDHD